jgi:hypothetical protein
MVRQDEIRSDPESRPCEAAKRIFDAKQTHGRRQCKQSLKCGD